MKFNKSKDFIDTINNFSREGKDIQIELHPKKYAFFEDLLRWGDWNGKHFEISGKNFLKNVEVEWMEDLDSLIEQLEGREISELGNDFYGWESLGDDGGSPEANEDGIKWFSADKKEIQLNDKELIEFEEVDVDDLWDQAGFENEDYGEIMMDEGGMWKIIVKIENNNFALISEEYFDQCDDEGNIQYNHSENKRNRWISILEEGNFKNDKKDGLWKRFHANNQLEWEGNYKDGKEEGLWKWYYENGQLKLEGKFKDGKLCDVVKHWYENGQLKTEQNYKDGEKDGLWKWYYGNDKLELEGYYKYGKEEGLWKGYYESGELNFEGMYKDGNKDGKWKGYYKNGELRKISDFKNGKELSLEEWDDNGNKITQ